MARSRGCGSLKGKGIGLALGLILLLCLGVFGSQGPRPTEGSAEGAPAATAGAPSDFRSIPAYEEEPYIQLNGGVPVFTDEELAAPEGTEVYGPLDSLGRPTFAFARICEVTRPPKGSVRERSMPDPTGFVQASYPDLDHLYERTHLIAYTFTDEAANPCDIITGTQLLNQDTMGDFEGDIRRYLEPDDRTAGDGRHVLMRVTPDFRDGDLVAHGVQIEALSLEDAGAAVKLNVYCYNVQPSVAIDYATGRSRWDPQGVAM